MNGYHGPDPAAMQARDNRQCKCWHACISHGSYSAGVFVGVGQGPCGIAQCECEGFEQL